MAEERDGVPTQCRPDMTVIFDHLGIDGNGTEREAGSSTCAYADSRGGHHLDTRTVKAKGPPYGGPCIMV
jgi:hypothetical protein